MSFLNRVASLAAMSFCVLGLGTATTASRAAELTSVTLRTTLSQASPAASTLPSITDPATTTAPVVTRFASLEDAVAAQGEVEGSGPTNEIQCLAGAIYFEAKGEPLPGQLAVANVILNRTRSGRFPADVCGVVTQRGQFSFVRDGRLPVIDAAARGYRTAVAMARVALAKTWNSPAPEALFFHARRVGVGRGIQIAAIGNHIFYR